MVVTLGCEKINSLERELAITTNGSVSHKETEAFFHSTYWENASQLIETRNIGSTDGTFRPDRLLESMKTLSGEINLTLSQMIDSLINIRRYVERSILRSMIE